jgi:hypothetical protein
MRRLVPGPLLTCCLALVPVTFPEGSARLEKVAEGQYMQWQDGHPVKDTAQSWTMWRTNDGFEIEDRLPVDNGALLMGVLGAELKPQMSPELREDMKNLTMKTNITLQLTKEKAIRVLVVNGKKINDAGQVEVANCQFKGEQIACKGHDASVRLKNAGQDQLLYAYPFPLLFTQVLTQSHPAPVQTNAVTLALLEEVNSKYQLTRVSGQLRGEGPESIVIGDKNFATDKFILTFATKSGPRQITLWTIKPGVVLAMEDSRFATGLRVVLSQYKKFSDF